MRGSAARVSTWAGWLSRAVERRYKGIRTGVHPLWLVLAELRYRYEMHAMSESSYLDIAWTQPLVPEPNFTDTRRAGRMGKSVKWK